MRNLRWAFLQFLIRWLAQSQGFLDPVRVLARLRHFSQPSEVLVPTEILRVSSVLHARGLINSQAIQHNLDWIWPYWVVRQFDPHDIAFVPRAFSLTHINLTHRNWTAVGLPDVDELPLVDPRGLVTPWLDGWSLDAWIIPEAGPGLFPSHARDARQECAFRSGLAVITQVQRQSARLQTAIEVIRLLEEPACRIRMTAFSSEPARLVLALRPYNPEGISFIHEVSTEPDRMGWQVNRKQGVRWNEVPDRLVYSAYRLGDVARRLGAPEEARDIACPVGMATAAAVFEIQPGQDRHLDVTVPLPVKRPLPSGPSRSWDEALTGCCQARLPDARWQMLFEAAVRTIVLHAGQEVYPGPYTYKRFWFRDAAFILQALVCMGLSGRAERALERFPLRQVPSGYFRSQDGEWDSNGQVLWTFEQFCLLTGASPKALWRAPLLRGARWLRRKRLSPMLAEPHAGLMPPGFSAEHLGPNDYYYWDNFWSVPGLNPPPGCSTRTGTRGQPGNCAVTPRPGAPRSTAAWSTRPAGWGDPPCRLRPTGAWMRGRSARWRPATRCNCGSRLTRG